MRSTLLVCALILLASPAWSSDDRDCREKNGMQSAAACSYEIKKKPDDAELYMFRGVGFYLAGSMEQALGDFTKAIALQPGLSDAYYLRGMIYEHISDPVHASEEYTRSISLNPYFADPYFSRGVILSRAGKTADALADVTKAVELDPEFVEALEALAALYRDAGKLDVSIDASNRAIAIDPYQPKLYRSRSNTFALKGDTAKAEADAKKAEELDPQIISIKRVTLHYNIRGKTAGTLSAQETAFGIRNHLTGGTSNGVTKSNYSWSHRYGRTLGGCAIEYAQTTLIITHLMPNWINRQDGSVGLRRSWDRHYAALLRHEHHHADIAIKASHDAQAALLKVTTNDPSCATIAKAANDRADAVFAVADKLQDKFDRWVLKGHDSIPRL